jgi:hypothetical protein
MFIQIIFKRLKKYSSVRAAAAVGTVRQQAAGSLVNQKETNTIKFAYPYGYQEGKILLKFILQSFFIKKDYRLARVEENSTLEIR